jgi:predicted phage terminase large subunit-like protein
MRSASNPGNIGHDWVKQRFMIEGETFGRVFIPAKLADNPNLDQQEYVKSLENLDPITRRQYLEGDWTARHGGSIFKREKFRVIHEAPADLENYARYWDMAATKPKEGKEPDYTVGALWGTKQGQYYCLNIQRLRDTPQAVEARIKQTAILDRQTYGDKVRIYMEQEPGSAGIGQADYYARQVLAGFSFWPVRTTGSKAERAVPLSSAVDADNVFIIQADWNGAFLDEFEAFPIGGHDDQVDASSGALEQLRVKFTPWVQPIKW